jgi:hypothetical protein
MDEAAPMTEWTSNELTKISAAEELRLASARADGTLRKPVTIWVVRHGDELYVRSVNGRNATWFRGAQERHEGHINAGGIDRDVSFVDADHEIDDALDAVYRAKYRRYPVNIVSSVLTPAARSTTLQLIPRSIETS